MVTLALRSCVARQEPYIPGALSILQGTVPGRVRGSGHMVPTYFRRELRDRALHRPSRLRTFLLPPSLFTPSTSALRSCPAKAGYPVRRGLTVRSQAPRNTGSPAFAGDDSVARGDNEVSRNTACTSRPRKPISAPPRWQSATR